MKKINIYKTINLTNNLYTYIVNLYYLFTNSTSFLPHSLIVWYAQTERKGGWAQFLNQFVCESLNMHFGEKKIWFSIIRKRSRNKIYLGWNPEIKEETYLLAFSTQCWCPDSQPNLIICSLFILSTCPSHSFSSKPIFK